MFAKLSSFVSSGPVFPYVLGEAFPEAWGQWTHFSGTKKEGNSPVSIFRISSSSKNEPKMTAARNGVKRLKLVRHPNILAFRDTLEVEEKGVTTIYLITEPVTPLLTSLDELEMSGAAREEYVAMGVFHIAKAVAFLNNDCKLIHGGVCLRAVVVTPALDWRLHGFDLLCEHAGAAAPAEWPLAAGAWLVGQQYKPGEVGRADWGAVGEGPPWAVDAWGLGCFVNEAFAGRLLARSEDLRDTAAIPKALFQEYTRLLATQPARRLNPAKLAKSPALRNRLVETIAFLDQLSVKDSGEKDQFFRKLPAAIPALPLPVAQRKLLPMLGAALEFGGAPALALGALLQIGKTLEGPEFVARVVPSLSKLFASSDRTIRRSLLEAVDTYGQHLDAATVEEQVYPHVSSGFNDANAYLRELTLKSMLVLAPKLSQKTLTQSLLKFLAKLQVDEEPGIRANTTILLGNMAQYLAPAACKRVLINAFSRALKDGFPPARTAGLKALLATTDRHGADEVATRIVPAVAPLTVDPVREVRHNAVSCLDAFAAILKTHCSSLDEQQAAAAAAAPGGSDAAAPGANPPGVSWGASLGSSGLSWAMSSIGLASGSAAAGGGGPPGGSKAPGSIGSQGFGSGSVPLPAEAPPRASPSSSFGAPAPERASVPAAEEPLGRASAGAAPAGDGWGSDADDFEVEDPAEVAARERLNRLTTARKPPRPAGGPPGGGASPARSKAPPVQSDSGADRGGWEDDASTHSTASEYSSVSGSAGTAADRARAAHVGLPGRPPSLRGRGRGLGAKPVGGMRLAAKKKDPSEGFEF